VYTGESLLEVILSDHAYKYHNENTPLSGAHVRGEHKVKECDRLTLFSIFFRNSLIIFIFLTMLCYAMLCYAMLSPCVMRVSHLSPPPSFLSKITSHVHLQSIDEKSTLPVWRSLLPSILYPAKIEVVIYLVKLQSTYEPTGASLLPPF
jgi:hypothetical protein